MKLIILIIWLNVIVCSQEQMIILKFSEPMDKQTLLLKSNYNLFNETFNSITINKIGVVEGDSAVIIFTDFLSYKTNFIIRVQNVKDKAGNLIHEDHDSAWFYVDGYNSADSEPKIIVKKK